MDNEQFSMLLEYFSFSWAGYQKVKKGVKKRILRHMTELGCRDMSDYIKRLAADSVVKYDCERLLTVPVSRFFRDYRLWEILPEKILPRFFADHTLRVWSAGCAGGEEIYSFKMIWEQLKDKNPDLPNLQTTASDLNPENLNRAQKGIYPASSFKEMPEDIRERFFEKGPTRKTWTIKSHLKSGIAWNTLNLLKGLPQDQVFDIIFLRNNILLYSSAELKRSGFKNVINTLTENGVLIIGTKDALPKGISGFKSVELPYVFYKIF